MKRKTSGVAARLRPAPMSVAVLRVAFGLVLPVSTGEGVRSLEGTVPSAPRAGEVRFRTAGAENIRAKRASPARPDRGSGGNG